MGFHDWAALILGAGLIFSGIRAIRRREANVPERWEGDSAVRLGWLWIVLGSLFGWPSPSTSASSKPSSACSSKPPTD